MKKNILICMLLAGACVQADVSVDWAASSGFYFNFDANSGILGAGTGNSTLAQLVYSLSGDVDRAWIGGGFEVGGDNIVWDSVVLTEGSNTSEWADFLNRNYTQSFVFGYVYARIFQNSSVNLNNWYYYTTPIALSDVVFPNAPQSIEMNTDFVNGNAIDFGSNVAQVIPEPATALLFILGSMGAWLVRRNNKMKADAEAKA
jgi:hypothetical protein